MKLNELLKQLGVPTDKVDHRLLNSQLVIATEPGIRPSIGGTSGVSVDSVSVGFDWDMGRLLIRPKTPLVSISPDEVRAIRESIRVGTSWHAFQEQTELRKQIAEQQAEIHELRAQLDSLKKSSTE